MRPAIVLIILALALLATMLVQTERRGSFDERFDRADERLKNLAESIDKELETSEERRETQ